MTGVRCDRSLLSRVELFALDADLVRRQTEADVAVERERIRVDLFASAESYGAARCARALSDRVGPGAFERLERGRAWPHTRPAPAVEVPL